ncbi:MAG: hypothetical protein JXQ65_01430 [Candidatus Marinimicrobia bacterium]|nr:hypothetical protein [Candidatus Neomarinimicrobiota bacterium]
MNRLIKYNFTKYSKNNYHKFLSKLIENNIEGIIINAVDEKSVLRNSNFIEEFYDSTDNMVYLAHERGLLTAVELDVFSSRYLWQHHNFSPPVSSHGAEYMPVNHYYPVCPNNKLSSERVVSMIQKISNIIPDYFILKEFRFPYNWEHGSLDLQEKIPNYCYCPFCIAEFSSEVGIVVKNLDTIYDNINVWMNWRFDVLEDYFDFIMDNLVPKKAVIVQTPPLNLVDIPFSTGQVLLEYGEKGAKISPLLFHNTRNRDFNWALEVLDIFKIDIPKELIAPAVQSYDIKQPWQVLPAYEDYEEVLVY